MSTRDVSAEELATLRGVLTESLPSTCLDDLTNVAVANAKAVKAAFEELAKPVITD